MLAVALCLEINLYDGHVLFASTHHCNLCVYTINCYIIILNLPGTKNNGISVSLIVYSCMHICRRMLIRSALIFPLHVSFILLFISALICITVLACTGGLLLYIHFVWLDQL